MDLYMCQDVNMAVKLMSSKLTFILDTMAPMRTIQIRKKYVPWLSTVTKCIMQERDRLHHIASLSGKDEDWQNFKIIRNKITRQDVTSSILWRPHKV